jgi:hypothetical protein
VESCGLTAMACGVGRFSGGVVCGFHGCLCFRG